MEDNQDNIKQNIQKKNNLLSVILTIIIVLGLSKYLFDKQDIFVSLQNLNFSSLLILTLLYFLYVLVLSYLNKIIFHKLNPQINTLEIINLQFINNFLNKILPKGGVAFRAVYLKNNYQLSYFYFVASFAGIVVVNLASQAVISLGVIAFIYFRSGLYNLIIILGFAAILLGSFFIIIINPEIPASNNWFLRNAKRLVEGWNIIVKNPKDMIMYVVISDITLFIDALNIYVVFYALGTPIQYSAALLLSSLSIILSYINITPDGLGVREGVYLYVASIVAITEPQILFGSIIQRAVSFLAALLFGSISYLTLIETKNKQFIKNKDIIGK